MARYRGTVQGQRGQASRLGGKSSGIVVRANGWGIGIYAEVRPCPTCGEDYAYASLTGGSGGDRHPLVKAGTAVVLSVCRKCDAWEPPRNRNGELMG